MKGAVTLKLHHGKSQDSRAHFRNNSILCYVFRSMSDACDAYFAASAFSIAAVTSGESGVTFGSNRATIWPSRPTKNFVKFH
jgi:hypothetical protein